MTTLGNTGNPLDGSDSPGPKLSELVMPKWQDAKSDTLDINIEGNTVHITSKNPSQQDYQAQRIEAGSEAMNRMGLYTPEWRQKLSIAIIAAADSVQCGDGYAMVPVHPTIQMLNAGQDKLNTSSLHVYRAMIAAHRTQKGD